MILEENDTKPKLNGSSDKTDSIQDLLESKRFIQQITDSAPNILYLFDIEQEKLIYVNKALHSILGYTNDFFAENGVDKFLCLIHPEDRELRIASIKELENSKNDQTVETEFRVKDKDGNWRWLYSRETVFSTNSKGSVTQILGTAEDVSKRKFMEDSLAKEAMYDNLTGLLNRRFFIEKLHESMVMQKDKRKYFFAVLFLDLDRFKIINDSLGHDIGDKLLVAVSKRLKNSARPQDVVSRLGGDEFTILLDNVLNIREIVKIVERIQNKLALPFLIGNINILTTAAIGIAPANKNYQDPEDILRDADTAMYRAKNHGRNSYALFNKHMHTNVLKALQTEADLRKAVKNNEFELYYQPVFSLSTNKIVGCEALVRWNHPKRGTLLPKDFLHIAEETGLLAQIDKWVLIESCLQNKDWQNKGYKPCTIAVNLSVKQLKQKKFSEFVRSVLSKTKMDSKYLELELTENVLLENSESTSKTFKYLKKMGIQLAIDDFGTGYSSLTYLKDLPANILKIDQSFIKDLIVDKTTTAIVQSIISLAHSLHLKVVAEGVENQSQLVFLQEQGCDQAQGFLYGRPMKAKAFTKLIAYKT